MLDVHEKYLHRCTICHDQCQFTVAELFASGRMAFATSRKAMLIQAVRRGDLDWTPEVVEVMYAGLNSGIQHEVCVDFGDPEGWSDETRYLRDARVEIVKAGKAPGWAEQIRQEWISSGNPYGLSEDIPVTSGEPLFYFDAATRRVESDSMNAWTEIARRLDGPAGVLASGSSGFELYDLGFVDEARQAARALYEKIVSLHPQRLVSDSPEAVYMMTNIWPAWELNLGVPIAHTSEWLAERIIASGIELPASGDPFTYLDPSCLSRYLDVTEPPRQVLQRFGVRLVEMVRNRKQALPSGSYFGEQVGGWVDRIARDLQGWAAAVGAVGIITASPFDYWNLSAYGTDDLKILSLGRAVRDRLEQRGG